MLPDIGGTRQGVSVSLKALLEGSRLIVFSLASGTSDCRPSISPNEINRA